MSQEFAVLMIYKLSDLLLSDIQMDNDDINHLARLIDEVKQFDKQKVVLILDTARMLSSNLFDFPIFVRDDILDVNKDVSERSSNYLEMKFADYGRLVKYLVHLVVKSRIITHPNRFYKVKYPPQVYPVPEIKPQVGGHLYNPKLGVIYITKNKN